MTAVASRPTILIALLLASPAARADLAIPGGARAASDAKAEARPYCNVRVRADGSPEPHVWHRALHASRAIRRAREWMRILAKRDAARLLRRSRLPFRLTTETRKSETRRAADARSFHALLTELLQDFPVVTRAPDDEPPADDLPTLAAAPEVDIAHQSDGATRVRFCADYHHIGDGTFDELEVIVDATGAVREVYHGWFQQR